jgi:hypothetical protein
MFRRAREVSTQVEVCSISLLIKENLTDDKDAKKMSPKELSRVATIRLEITRRLRTGERSHKKVISGPRCIAVPLRPVPEGSKAAEIGVSTR